MPPRKILLLDEESLKAQSLLHIEHHSEYCPVRTRPGATAVIL